MKKVVIYVLSALALAVLFIYVQIPSETKIKSCFKTSLYDVELCSGSKNYVKLNQISSVLQRTILITEDAGFYTHSGFDREGIQHCFQKMKEKMKIVCGGSTITQQLAKNLFLTKDKTFYRKGLEALITVKLEKTLTKKEILEKYLNVVQFGKNIFGIKQAAQFYFKKHPSQLDAVESAFLAMILPNPEKYSQSYYRKDLTRFARNRILRIINDMYRYKSLGSDGYINALNKLDYFLSSGQKSVNADPLQLSDEDLSEMKEEEAFVESIQKTEPTETHSSSDPTVDSAESVSEEELELEQTFDKMSE